MISFLVVHGFQNRRPAGHWEPRLAGELLPDDVRRRVRLVASDDDPCCRGGALEVYGRPIGLAGDVVPGGGHLDLEAGYGSWPSVLRWCTDPTVRIAGR